MYSAFNICKYTLSYISRQNAITIPILQRCTYHILRSLIKPMSSSMQNRLDMDRTEICIFDFFSWFSVTSAQSCSSPLVCFPTLLSAKCTELHTQLKWIHLLLPAAENENTLLYSFPIRQQLQIGPYCKVLNPVPYVGFLTYYSLRFYF